jgi:hypothetical protein
MRFRAPLHQHYIGNFTTKNKSDLLTYSRHFRGLYETSYSKICRKEQFGMIKYAPSQEAESEKGISKL